MAEPWSTSTRLHSLWQGIRDSLIDRLFENGRSCHASMNPGTLKMLPPTGTNACHSELLTALRTRRMANASWVSTELKRTARNNGNLLRYFCRNIASLFPY